MPNVYTDTYWTDEFEITTADLDRIATHIHETGQAHDLTALARRVVRGRLHYGPETSVPAQAIDIRDPSVRLWDPAGEWTSGDQIIAAVHSFEDGAWRHAPYVGEVVNVTAGRVSVQIDALDESKTYVTHASQDELEKWRRFVEDLVKARRESSDIEERVEFVILEHGERVVSQLFDALRADERFVRLAGRWFLHELAAPATDEQLAALAWAMVCLEEPQSTDDLVPLVQPPPAEGDPGLFGLYLAMRRRDDLFANADPGQRPRWVLAGPPPGSFTPRHAAYDPESYEVLCLPNEPASPETVHRLWELNLLEAVV
jgi:hypothetical protein